MGECSVLFNYDMSSLPFRQQIRIYKIVILADDISNPCKPINKSSTKINALRAILADWFKQRS